MTNATSVIGWIVLVLLAIAVIIFAIGYAAERIDSLLTRYKLEVVQNAMHNTGRALQGDSHWFGESPEVALAIKVLGESMARHSGWDVSNWREEWRRQRNLRT